MWKKSQVCSLCIISSHSTRVTLGSSFRRQSVHFCSLCRKTIASLCHIVQGLALTLPAWGNWFALPCGKNYCLESWESKIFKDKGKIFRTGAFSMENWWPRIYLRLMGAIKNYCSVSYNAGTGYMKCTQLWQCKSLYNMWWGWRTLCNRIGGCQKIIWISRLKGKTKRKIYWHTSKYSHQSFKGGAIF